MEVHNRHQQATEFSLGVLFLQILNGKLFEGNFNHETVLAYYCNQHNRQIQFLIGDIFTSDPSKRPKAFEISQRFLDEYNDGCLKVFDPGLSGLLEKVRKWISTSRLDYVGNKEREAKSVSKSDRDQSQRAEGGESQRGRLRLSEDETQQILQSVESWDEPGSRLRLGPECMFIIGAGLVWDLIDINHVPAQASHVSREIVSTEGIRRRRCLLTAVYRYKVAVYFLTQAEEMGYYDTAFELLRSHSFLARWYHKNGGENINRQLMESVKDKMRIEG